jgi:hypothetical protein
MGFADRIRAFFSKRGNPRLDALVSFAANRKGLEGFIEPRTATSPTTLLLVDRDGDHARAPVGEPRDAVVFCERLGIPVYDARVIGYPQRMKDFERRRAANSEDIDAKFEELERRFDESDPNIPDH